MTRFYDDSQDIILTDADLSLLEEMIGGDDTIIEKSDDFEEDLSDQLYVTRVNFAEKITKEFKMLAELYNVPAKGPLSMMDLQLPKECIFTPPFGCIVPGITPKGIMTSMRLLGGVEEFFPEKAIVIASTGRVVIRMRPLYASSCSSAEFVLSTSKDELDALSNESRAIDKALDDFLCNLFDETMMEFREGMEDALREHHQRKSFFSISENYGTAQVW